MSPDPVWPGLFLPCSLPRLLPAAAGGGLEPSPARRFRGASPHRLLSYAKEPPVAASFAHGALKIGTSGRAVAGVATMLRSRAHCLHSGRRCRALRMV